MEKMENGGRTFEWRGWWEQSRQRFGEGEMILRMLEKLYGNLLFHKLSKSI